MACVSQILAGLLDDCETSKGGIKKIWITTEDPKPIIELNIIASFNNVVDWYEYNFKKNSSSFTSNYTIDNTNGVNYVTTELVLQVNKMNTVKRIEMANLAVNEMYIIVLDSNNKYWYLGYDEPVTATTGNGLTGTVKTDGNFYQITFTDESNVLPYEVDKNVIENLYKNDPLKFTAAQNSSISIGFSEELPITLYATKNFKEILTITTPGWSATLNEGESIYIFGDNPEGLYNAKNDLPMAFYISGLVDISGNIMALIGEEATEIPGEYCFSNMFLLCDIRTAPQLPAKKLTKGCYSNMFARCSTLVNAPVLPALNLADNCYKFMFEGCSALVKAPALPATTLASNCYQSMFLSCISLTKAPALPAMELAEKCYSNMFLECLSLTDAPMLPALNLTESCYYGMFVGCRNLSKVQDVLPALNLADRCYYGMFNSCSSLTKAPALPAVVLAPGCYQAMFILCINLEEAPALPAMELAEECYSYMFNECINLASAPVLPAIELKSRCYATMFFECGKLNYIEIHAEQLEKDSLSNWLSHVAGNGTIKKKATLNLPSGASGIPVNWTVEAI